MIEIEAKARVAEGLLENIRAYFNKRYAPESPVFKLDYYIKGDGEKFRIRQCGDKFFYTKKKRHIDKDGFESNQESECEIDKNRACDILKETTPYFTKTKKGFLWHTTCGASGANIELLEVNSLGWFLEIEVLLSQECKSDDADAAKIWVYSQFSALGLENSIEKRKYMEMLQDGRQDNSIHIE